MMLSQKHAIQQIERLEGLPGFPVGHPAAILELAKALETAPSGQAAEQWVTDWLANEAVCPVPAEVRAAFRQEPKPPQDCLLCGGTGWISKEIGGVWGAKRCACGA